MPEPNLPPSALPQARCAASSSAHPALETALREAVTRAQAGLAGAGDEAGATLAVVFVSAAYGEAIRPAQ